ncbi:MAG TPA: hypothetical protein PKM88_14775, partial [bacterium]|nr:hypothetical protein [bacterium]
MRTMGIALQKNFLRYSIMEGTRSQPLLIDKGRLATADPGNTVQLMDWYETTFSRILTDYKPAHIGYKLSLEPTIEQIHNLSFPLGLLNLLAYRNRVRVSEYSVRA